MKKLTLLHQGNFPSEQKVVFVDEKRKKVQPGWFKQHSQRKTAVSYMTESKSLREDTKEERELSQSERILL